MHTAPALPARWRPWQRRKNTAIYAAVRIGVALLRRLPARLRRRLGSGVGLLAWAVARPQRRLANQQLAWALPALTPGQRRQVVRQMFGHLGRSAFELLNLPAALAAHSLDAASQQVLRQALGEGRGVLAISGHLGNWELLAQAVAHCDLPLTMVAKPLYDPRLTAWLHQERSRFGAHIVWRGQAGSSRALLRALRDKNILALLLDQDTRVDGVFAPFFGRPAHTPSAAASLALRLQTPVVFGYDRITAQGHSFHFERLNVAALVAGVPPDAQVQALTAAFNARLEQAVRAHPAQWVWLHRRWRQQPAAPQAPVPTQAPRPRCLPTALLLAVLLACGVAHAKAPADPAQGLLRRPVAFRCDRMSINERAHTGSCTGNVVLREGNMLLCCNAFVGQADASWQWQSFACTGEVRVQQLNDAAWADRADGELNRGLLTLRGKPLLKRGQSVLQGDAVRLWQQTGSAEVDRPRGEMFTAALQTPAPKPQALPAWASGALPERCPLPEAPRP